MDDEPSGVDAQAHHVTDQLKRDKGQQHGQRQQKQVQLRQVLVHTIHQVYLIGHIGHLRILPDFLSDPFQ